MSQEEKILKCHFFPVLCSPSFHDCDNTACIQQNDTELPSVPEHESDLLLTAVFAALIITSSLPQIFFFCFNFLKHIVSEKFSAVRKQR